MSIVCGIDFSESSTRAARVAAALARGLTVPLELVHVVDELGAELTFESEQRAIYEPRRQELQERAAELKREFGVEVKTTLVPGTTHEALLRVAGAARATLLVVAAAGANASRHWLLGSTARKVAQAPALPVLVVSDAARLEQWANGSATLRVLVGVELATTSRAALSWAAGLRRVGRCDLQVAHVVWPPVEHFRKGVAAVSAPDALLPEVHDLLMRDVLAWAGDVPGEGETRFEVIPAAGRADAVLASYAAEKDVDLIVVGTRPRSPAARFWRGSVSEGVLEAAGRNTACVPFSERFEEEGIPVYRRVLAPTDFSPAANRALRVAYGLVAPAGVIHLLHVVTEPIAPGEPDPERRLCELVPRGAASKGVLTEFEVVTAESAGLGIWQAAERLGVDVICMATRGRSAVASLVLGSQAQAVLQRARQPLVLVPPERS